MTHPDTPTAGSETPRPYKLIGCVQHDCEACITREKQYKERCAELSDAQAKLAALEAKLREAESAKGTMPWVQALERENTRLREVLRPFVGPSSEVTFADKQRASELLK